ncbi:NACHT domain-containing protein [Streptomyces olivochromogenes]|uniref:NACHT domain-containing protein n=1 Tax=Streptomyces olivochromogenes TaxID=1963 RepID=UPI001F3DECC1|nr:NACHT domain-containing protein [Streptomyces olivochromogenes]MCF3132448.1 NACHT domain-containing protein [Streptomyces olivochromogenes]
MAGAFLVWYITRGHRVASLIAAVTAFTLLLGIPAAVIAVLRLGKSGPTPARLEDVADQLARGVHQQWETEAQVRRLNDPFPLSVEWVAAEADLVESWPHLKELAGDWPGQSPEATFTWAASPRGLAGSGGEIAQVFERVPTRRLVILGESGSGKTVLFIRFLLALLKNRTSGGPVPVLFSLAAWDPVRQDLYTWMADELIRDHPALRALVPADLSPAGTVTQARALLAERLILPILDGLDEVPQAMRARALDNINQVLPAGQPLVLSSRTAEYRSALATPAGTTLLLNGAAGIRLLPLDPAKAAAYLERDAGGSGTGAANRWRRVTASLSTDTPVSQALSTPLGLFLARTIYNPRPDEQIVALPDPSELIDQARFPTRQDIDTHLFAAFIPAAYRHHPVRWSAQQAQRTFTFLAGHLQDTLDGTPDLAWWQLSKVLRHFQEITVGLTVGLIGSLPLLLLVPFEGDLAAGITSWLVLVMLCLVPATMLASSAGRRKPSSAIRWSWKGKSWFTVGLSFGFLFGLIFGSLVGSTYGFRTGLISGLAGGLPFVVLGGLRSVHPDLDKTVGPGVILARDRRTFCVLTVAGGLAGALASVLATLLELGFGVDPAGLAGRFLFGLVFGIPVGLLIGLARSVWVDFLVARIRLALLGHLPWRFMTFLADAHERRGVLRQVGAVYQFRHIDLQRHLTRHQP